MSKLSEVKAVNIFLSYSSKDKKDAGFIKSELESYGFNVFLAHEDIEPTKQWQTVLIDNLEHCDVFIPLLTNNFQQSNWTGQESGYALSRKILIIPVQFNVLPFGFLGKIQALKVGRYLNNTCYEIAEIIKKDSMLTKKMREYVLSLIKKSSNKKEVSMIIPFLLEWGPFNKMQINEVIEILFKNNQYLGDYFSSDIMKEVMKHHKEIISPKKYSEIINMLNDSG